MYGIDTTKKEAWTPIADDRDGDDVWGSGVRIHCIEVCRRSADGTVWAGREIIGTVEGNGSGKVYTIR